MSNRCPSEDGRSACRGSRPCRPSSCAWHWSSRRCDRRRAVVSVLRIESLLLLSDDVRADREAVGERRRHRVVRGRAAGPAVGVARRHDALDVGNGDPRFAIRPLRRSLARIAVLGVAGERRPVVARLQRVDEVAAVRRVDVEVQLAEAFQLTFRRTLPFV